jgi:type IV pilus assembly protein PilN
MIKINLLSVERKAAKKKIAFQSGQKITAACTLLLVGAALVVGWRYLSLQKASDQLDQDITSAQQEASRLRTIIQQVQQFEQRKAQLQQRVALIEQLRRDQTGPVHMLDQISRALPAMLWLTGLKQGASPTEVLIEGRSTTQTGVSDFAANLEASGFFRRSVDIVSTQTEATAAANGELIRFTLRAEFLPPGAAAAKPPAGAPAAPPPAPRPGG